MYLTTPLSVPDTIHATLLSSGHWDVSGKSCCPLFISSVLSPPPRPRLLLHSFLDLSFQKLKYNVFWSRFPQLFYLEIPNLGFLNIVYILELFVFSPTFTLLFGTEWSVSSFFFNLSMVLGSINSYFVSILSLILSVWILLMCLQV